MVGSFEDIVRFNAQTSGREKLIRLCQYISKFAGATLLAYHAKVGKGGNKLLEIIFKFRELEQYFLSCRRLVNFGRCSDHLYSAIRSLQLYDPVVRTTLAVSKLSTSFQLFADHVLWLNQVGFVTVDKQVWLERMNKFWLYSATVNLLRDFYELICIVQQHKTRANESLDSSLKNIKLSTPFKWALQYPKLSCDVLKNACDFWIPYASVNKIRVHPALVASLGIVSTACSILQVYDQKYRLSPC